MTLRDSLLIVVVATVFPLGASAQSTVNPDNDWASFFRYQTPSNAIQPAPGARGMPKLGDVSADGQLVFLGDQRGWQPRPYVYEVQGTRLVHAADCPYVVAARSSPPKVGRAG